MLNASDDDPVRDDFRKGRIEMERQQIYETVGTETGGTEITGTETAGTKTGQKAAWVDRMLEGSFTVEMSMLFPIILVLLAGIIIWTFYLWDLVKVRAMICEYGEKEYIWIGKAEQRRQSWKEVLTGELLVAGIDELEILDGEEQRKVRVCLHCSLAVPGIHVRNRIDVQIPKEKKTAVLIRQKVMLDTISHFRESGQQEEKEEK